MGTPSWIQYTEKVVGENHPSLTDVVNRPIKTIHNNFLVGHDAGGAHTVDKLILTPSPAANYGYSGLVATMTVDTNAEGIGAPLYMAADGHLETADADANTTMPCVAMALETLTGSKFVLMQGFIRVDAWTWSSFGAFAGLLYVSTTVGTLTQTKPSGTGDQVQIVGFATHADRMFFNPQYPIVEIS